METKSDRTAAASFGYATGMGLVGIVVFGIPLQFAAPDISAVLTYGGSFLVGALLGLAVSAVRGTRVQ